MYSSSIGSQAYTISVWMFADWLNRNPAYVTLMPEHSPVTWVSEQWLSAAKLEEGLRLFGPDERDENLAELLSATADDIKAYVLPNSDDGERDRDGIFRRLPDQLVNLLLHGTGDERINAVGAMEDALDLIRNVKKT